LLTIQECVYEGVYIIRLEGRVVSGQESAYLKTYVKRRIEQGVRFFILDTTNVDFLDSGGIDAFTGLFVRAKMRAGRTIFINSRTVSEYFQITKLQQIVDTAKDLHEAFKMIFQQPIEVPADLKFEDQYTVMIKGPEGARKLVVEDKTIHPPEKTEYTIREIPPPERLSIVGMAGVAFGTLIYLSLLVTGLIWITKQVSSVLVLVLIFSVAFLVSFCLLGLLLLLSGHLSEKTAEKLFSGVLGKIPGLGMLVPKIAARRGKS
jgi:anti-anti-sigma factor